jgi:hypothetical protein
MGHRVREQGLSSISDLPPMRREWGVQSKGPDDPSARRILRANSLGLSQSQLVTVFVPLEADAKPKI